MKIKYDPKKIIVYILTIILSIVFFLFANQLITSGESVLNRSSDHEYIRGEVKHVISSEKNDYGDIYTTFTITTPSGEKTATQVTSDLASENIRTVKKGDDVIIVRNTGSSQCGRGHSGPVPALPTQSQRSQASGLIWGKSQ